MGSIYLSTVDINPSELFGFGKWEQVQDRFLLGAGENYEAGSEGGEAIHMLTVDEMPSHSHQVHYGGANSIFGHRDGGGWSCAVTLSDLQRYSANTGGSQPHNNMPPYLVVYIWKRVE